MDTVHTKPWFCNCQVEHIHVYLYGYVPHGLVCTALASQDQHFRDFENFHQSRDSKAKTKAETPKPLRKTIARIRRCEATLE